MSLNNIFLEQNCEFTLKNCNFAGAAGAQCASQFCFGFPSTSGTCPQIGLDPTNCCGSSDPASCLNAWVHNGGGAGSGAAANPCASVLSMLIGCSSASPAIFPSSSFYTSGKYATSLAGCLCYEQDGTYDTILDDFAATCVASGEAAHPTYYKYGTALQGFCTKFAGPAANSASVTTTSAAGGSSSSSSAVALSTTSATGTKTSATSGSSVSMTSSAAMTSSTATSAGAASSSSTSKSSAARVKNPVRSTLVGSLIISALAAFF